MREMWTRKFVLKLIEAARKAGQDAAKARLHSLEEHGPRWVIHNNELDICGNGFIHLRDARRYQTRALLKTYRTTDESREWSLRRDDVRGGYDLDIWYMGNGRQELSVNLAAVEAAAQVLRNAGLDCNAISWID